MIVFVAYTTCVKSVLKKIYDRCATPLISSKITKERRYVIFGFLCGFAWNFPRKNVEKYKKNVMAMKNWCTMNEIFVTVK